MGTAVQLLVTNNEVSELYLSVLVIDLNGGISVVFPNSWVTTEEVTLVRVDHTLEIPDPSKDTFVLKTQAPKGISEVLILASCQPLRKALQTLRSLASV